MKKTTPKKNHSHPECVVKQLCSYPITDATLHQVNQKIDYFQSILQSKFAPDLKLRQMGNETNNSFAIFASGDHLNISEIINFKKR